jgi:hypothetical protein
MKEEPGQTTIGPRFSKNTQRAKNWNFLLSRTWRIFASFLHSCLALPRTWGANPQNGNAEGKLFVVSFVNIYIYNMFAFYKRFCLKYLFQLFVIFILNSKLLELSIKSGKDSTSTLSLVINRLRSKKNLQKYSYYNKVIRKIRKRRHGTPCLVT